VVIAGAAVRFGNRDTVGEGVCAKATSLVPCNLRLKLPMNSRLFMWSPVEDADSKRTPGGLRHLKQQYC
jgi:hypothetical protein